MPYTARFGLRSLFILIAICGLCASALLPYLSYVRAKARLAACEKNLQLIGLHMHAHANSDPQTRLSTGAPDFVTNGDISKNGWLADAVNGGPAELRFRCMANPVSVSGVFNDIAAADGPTKAVELAANGYNTNYTASWYLAYSQPVLDIRNYDVGPVTPKATADKTDYVRLGPLAIRTVESSHIVASTIPLLADSRAMTDLKLDLPVARKGAPTAAAFTSGPVRFAGGRFKPLTAADNVLPQLVYEQNTGPQPARQSYFRQDTRAWGAPHVVGRHELCNMLMADGSIRTFSDINGDGYLDPGFDVAPFQPGPTELTALEVTSQIALKPYLPKSCFGECP